MGIKRTFSAVEDLPHRTRSRALRRTRLSPTTSHDRDSSESSSGGLSEDTALESSPEKLTRRRRSSQSSVQSAPSDHGSDHSLSSVSSDEEAGDYSEDEEEIVTIGGPEKPRITGTTILSQSEDLRSRLKALLPQLKASNQLLGQGDGAAGLEDVVDGEEHIEMNLGLGVLEEKGEDHDSESSSDDSESGTDLDEEEKNSSTLRGHGSLKGADLTKDIMSKLLGQDKEGSRRACIQDLEQ